MLTATCQCGAVRIQTRGAPVNVRLCHCRLCQAAMSGPYFARAFFLSENIDLTGDVIRHPSSKHLDRVSCATCGTRVGAWRRDGSGAGIPLALLEAGHGLRPTDQIWVSRKMDWVVLDPALPAYAEGAPV